MHFRTRTWFIISMLCLLGALVFWQLGERKAARDRARRERQQAEAGLTNAPNPTPAVTPSPASRTNAAAAKTNSYLLSNTTKTVDQLLQSEHSLLLNNAHIDSTGARANPVNLAIPPHLRAMGDPGSYIVQGRGPLSDPYRAALQRAGAEIVSYIPNNAFLVQASKTVADRLAGLADTQSAFPWEPTSNWDPDLWPTGGEQRPRPRPRNPPLCFFPGRGEAGLKPWSRLKGWCWLRIVPRLALNC